jgi:hypothetical protein
MNFLRLDSRITAVTVFQQGALVVRESHLDGQGEIPPGLRLGNLPLCLDDASVRVRLLPAESAADPPVPCDLRVGLEVPPWQESLSRDLDDELHAAQRAQFDCEQRLEQLRHEQTRWEKLAWPAPGGKDDGELPPDRSAARLALLEFQGEYLAEIVQLRLEAEKALVESQRLVEHLLQQVRLKSSARQAREHELRKSVSVMLRGDVAAARGGRLQLEYLVPGARWAPAYTVRFGRNSNEALLSVQAMVCQATGEDWNAVRLMLSTANPHSWSELPELTSLRVGRRQAPVARSGWRPPPLGSTELVDDFLLAVRSAREPSTTSANRAVPPTTAVLGLTGSQSPAPPSAARGLAAATAAVGAVQAKLGRVRQARGTAVESAEPASAEAEAESPTGAVAAPNLLESVLAAPARRDAAALADLVSEMHAGDATHFDAHAAVPGVLLDYAGLRLAGPEDPLPGWLGPSPRGLLYQELLREQEITVNFDVVAIVQAAVRLAVEAPQAARPSRVVFPGRMAGFDFCYATASVVDIASDAAFHGVPIAAAQTQAHRRYVSVPRESPLVFRFAELPNPLDVPLLEGPVDIFMGEDFLATSHQRSVPPRGAMRLGLGVEESLKVARNVEFREETGGLLGGSLELHHRIKLDIVSYLAHAAPVEIRERIPVMADGDDQAAIQVTDVNPAWESFEQEPQPARGTYRWTVLLGPGESRQLHAAYVIKLSSRNELVGGNRREA